MTLIPAGSKDLKHQQDQYQYQHQSSASNSIPHQTTNRFPGHNLSETHEQTPESHFFPPPYSETDSNSTFNHAPSDLGSAVGVPPTYINNNPPVAPPAPQSNAISASSSVNLLGPLHILGPVKASSSITLKYHVTVDGKIDSSSSVWLEGEVVVKDKVRSSSKVTLRDRVRVRGKVDASGGIELSNAIHINEKVSAAGAISLNGGAGGIFIGDKVSASGAIYITGGRIEILGPLKASGAIRISSHGKEMKGEEKGEAKEKGNMDGGYCGDERKCVLKLGGKVEGSSLSLEGDVEVIGDLYSSCILKLKGNLIVNGDLEVRGDLVIRKGDTVKVSGKRTIHGSIKEI